MIVKVQISVAGNRGKRVLIYNKHQSVRWQDAASKEVLALMDGEPKKFFEASINSAGKIILDAEADWQDW